MRRGVDYAALAGIGGSDEDDEDSTAADTGGRRALPPSRQHRAAENAAETPLSRGLTALALTRAGGVKDPNKVWRYFSADWFGSAMRMWRVH